MKVEGTDDIYDLTPAPGAVTEEGTFLNVENLLKDTTAALLGGDANMVPDEALVALKEAIDSLTPGKVGAAQIEIGSYTGNGNAGSSNPSSLSFSFPISAVIIVQNRSVPGAADGSSALMVAVKGMTGCYTYSRGDSNEREVGGSVLGTTWGANSLSWYTTATDYYASFAQMNRNGYEYFYIAIG